MPIYVYRSTSGGCERCREGFEAVQSFHEEPLTRCPHCGGAVRKVPAAFSMGKGSVLSSSNLKEHGFRKLRRKDGGGYVDET